MRFKNAILAACAASVIFIATLFITNAVSAIYMWHAYGLNPLKRESYVEYARSRLFLTSKEHSPSIVHPFFGRLQLGDAPVKSALSDEPLFSRIDKSDSEEDIKVLIVGGSVAANTSSYGEGGMFARILNSHYTTNLFSVYNAAFGGGKQPVQYFKTVYLDLLGFTPDIIINLDGFNEVALALSENFNLQNPAIYPRSFSSQVESNSNVARACLENSDGLIRMGAYMPLIAIIADRYYMWCKAGIENVQLPWWRNLMKPAAFDTYVRQAQAIWENSSKKLNDFALAHGIDYVHVLQPNQYFPDSKPFSDEELKETLSLPFYGDLIRKYYSLLSRNSVGDEQFYDQRMLFKEENRTVYEDNCCHFNQLGNELLIGDIVAHFSAVFEKHLTARQRR